jgi:hypothetical protein
MRKEGVGSEQGEEADESFDDGGRDDLTQDEDQRAERETLAQVERRSAQEEHGDDSDQATKGHGPTR